MPEPRPQECAILIRLAFKQAYEGMRVLREKVLLQPYLAVLYSSIDAAAWLSAQHDGDVTRKDFEPWVDRYVLPDSGLKCTSTDLFAARCGVLHSFSAYSSLQRKGAARLLSYVWGNANVKELEELMGRLDPSGSVVVQLDDLTNSFFRGLERSLQDLESKPDSDRWLLSRAGYLFASLDRAAVQRAVEMSRRANG